MTVDVSEARQQWLSELYKANSAAVFYQCRRLLKSPEDAADATQEIFLRAATSLSQDLGAPQARAWLNTVARNYCIDLIRRRERLGVAVTTLAATADAPVSSVQSVEDRELLLAILPRLGERERQALWQSAVEDLPLTEIARSFGISYLAAAQLLHRARRRALLLATRLAIILGLARLSQAWRRSRFIQLGQQVAAVVALPVAVALLAISSSAEKPPTRAHAQAPVAFASAGHSQKAPVKGTLPATGPPASSPSLPAPMVALAPPVRASGVEAATVVAAPKPVTVTVKPVPPPTPAPVDRDKDHGKGHDRDDLAHKHTGGGKGNGHGR